MRLTSRFIFFCVLSICISLYACQRPAPSGTDAPSKLMVLTTIPPLYSFTKNIAGDSAEVENLLPSGTGPHEYASSPSDLEKISRAQVIIKNGAGLETWLKNLMASAGKSPFIVDTSSGIDILDNDPHIWLSVKNAVIQVENIRDALAEADPDNADLYISNAAQYIGRLEKLDQEINDEVSGWETKEFIAFHSAFLYFTRDYGLRQAAAIQEFPDKQPSPGHIADVTRIIKEKGIKTIFSEAGVRHKMIESMASDLELRVLRLNTLETGELRPGFYEDMMRKNVSELKKALDRDI